MTAPLPLGTEVQPWGVISAVCAYFGERYYFFSETKGVAMIPAIDVERNYREQSLPQEETK